MHFYITIIIERKSYRLKVEQTFKNEVREEYKISGRTQSIIVSTNRPLFRNKGLKHRRADWKLLHSSINIYASLLEQITTEINKKIDL